MAMISNKADIPDHERGQVQESAGKAIAELLNARAWGDGGKKV